MAVGYDVNRSAIDTQAGTIACNLRDVLAAVGRFHARLCSLSDEELTGGRCLYTPEEVACLREVFGKFDGLREVYERDCRDASRQLEGVF